MSTVYDQKPWRDLSSRIRERTASCALAILAGNCRGALQAHHILPVAEGGPEIPAEDGVAVLCARHHALVHAWRKQQEPQWKRCPHQHRTREAREQCERRLNGF